MLASDPSCNNSLGDDPVGDPSAKKQVQELLKQWWRYIRTGPQSAKIVQTNNISKLYILQCIILLWIPSYTIGSLCFSPSNIFNYIVSTDLQFPLKV
jgi:hypothetical protein